MSNGGGGGDVSWEPDPLISELEAVQPDPPVETRILFGYLGEGSDGMWRLYRSLELDAYLEGRQDDLVHVIHLWQSNGPLAGSVVWVKSDALLEQHEEFTADSPQAYGYTDPIRPTPWCHRVRPSQWCFLMKAPGPSSQWC